MSSRFVLPPNWFYIPFHFHFSLQLHTCSFRACLIVFSLSVRFNECQIAIRYICRTVRFFHQRLSSCLGRRCWFGRKSELPPDCANPFCCLLDLDPPSFCRFHGRGLGFSRIAAAYRLRFPCSCHSSFHLLEWYFAQINRRVINVLGVAFAACLVVVFADLRPLGISFCGLVHYHL